MKMNNYELIENIQARRPLWDKTTWDKVDIITREELWDEIADKMGSTKEIVRARWRNLRDSYRKILKKMENLEINDPKWSYFRAMEFMKHIIMNTRPRNADITLRKSEVISIEPDYSITLVTTTEEDDASNDPLSYGNQIQHNRISSIKDEPQGNKRQSSEDIVTQYFENEADKTKIDDEKQGPSRIAHEDDDYQFLLSLHPHFKQVPLNRKLPLRMKIEQLIYEELFAENSTSTT